MATVCKKKRVKYNAYFYNDIYPYQCATCNAEFKEKKDLDEHVSNVHDGKNPLKCDLCESTFARINELNRHRNSVHRNTAPHRCESCNEDYDARQKRGAQGGSEGTSGPGGSNGGSDPAGGDDGGVDGSKNKGQDGRLSLSSSLDSSDLGSDSESELE